MKSYFFIVEKSHFCPKKKNLTEVYITVVRCVQPLVNIPLNRNSLGFLLWPRLCRFSRAIFSQRRAIKSDRVYNHTFVYQAKNGLKKMLILLTKVERILFYFFPAKHMNLLNSQNHFHWKVELHFRAILSLYKSHFQHTT